MNDIKLQKNFDTWCKRNLPDVSSESKESLWLMYVYFSNRIEEKDNKIAKLKDKLNDIELLDDPSGEGKWLG
jgi:hypothetical protein